MPAIHPDQPVPVDLRSLFVANGFRVFATILTDDVRHAAPKFPEAGLGPGIVMHFCAAGLPHGLTVLLPAAAIDPDLGPAFAEVCASVLDPDSDPRLAENTARAAELNRLAGVIPGGPVVRCPGCTARLYGDVAVRGGCLTCYPDLGPLEEAANLEAGQ